MTRRQRVLAAVRGKPVDRVPTAFWLHFPPDEHTGDAAIQAHIDFFNETEIDLLKVMNEHLLKSNVPINTAEDWKKVRPLSLNDPDIVDQLNIIKALADKIGDDAVLITTIHGAFASAIHTLGGTDSYESRRSAVTAHLRENQTVVGRAIEIITEGLIHFVEACLDAGAQGIYYAALGGERSVFDDETFLQYVKPNDLAILNAAQNATSFNVLHICKENVNLERYRDYRPEVVNWAIHEHNPSFAEGKDVFPESAFLGGLDDRSGVLVSGTSEQIEQAVFRLLDAEGTTKFIVGSDCTVPTDIDYGRIKTVVEATKKYATQ